MNKITLTKRGKDILTQNTLQGGEVYWVGYFGLAYVPDQSGFTPEQSKLIGDEEHGDYIYNIWQGDLINEGHSIASADNLNRLSKLTLYDRNITSNFRYMYDDENDRNRMVTWVTSGNGTGSSASETSSYIREGFRVYNGITLGDSHNTGDIEAESELPCPAPLFYAGGSAVYSNPSDTPEEFVHSVVSDDWPMNEDGAPLVTPDMRFYGGSWKGGRKGTDWNWIPDGAGKFDTIPAEDTRNSVDSSSDPAVCLDQYAKFISVSNFNKEHGHVSSEGYGVGYQESCHNMSMVTRLFPIANYELTATSDPATDDRNITERGSAKSIKYVIRLNLKAAYQSVRAYLDTLTYTSTNGSTSGDDAELYKSSKPNSFKFNRIGIYAVRTTIRHFYKEGDANNRTDCRATHYQMEISPDARPELFAVMQVDEVGMSEDGSFGLSDYNTTFVLNLENTPENTDLCTNPEVYYNLVENEAITWYQNQLIATAGLSEAVTNIGVEMAYLMNRVGGETSATTCSPTIIENGVQQVSQTTSQSKTVINGGGILILQDDGVIVPVSGHDASGLSNVMFASFNKESVDKVGRKPRFSLFQDGKFTTYEWVSDVPAYMSSGDEAFLLPGATNHIVWNTWYSITANGKFQSFSSGSFKYYDLNADTIVTIDNADIAAVTDVGDGVALYLNDTSDKSDYVLHVSQKNGNVLTGRCIPTLMSINESATTIEFPKVKVNEHVFREVEVVTTPDFSSHTLEFVNPARKLNISYESLVDGIVYEIRVNIRSIACWNATDGFIEPNGQGGMSAPDISSRPFEIYFYTSESGTPTPKPTYMWGGGDDEIGYYIRPTFNRVPYEGQQVAFFPVPSNTTAPVLASAIIYFVKVDGNIYVMGY